MGNLLSNEAERNEGRIMNRRALWRSSAQRPTLEEEFKNAPKSFLRAHPMKPVLQLPEGDCILKFKNGDRVLGIEKASDGAQGGSMNCRWLPYVEARNDDPGIGLLNLNSTGPKYVFTQFLEGCLLAVGGKGGARLLAHVAGTDRDNNDRSHETMLEMAKEELGNVSKCHWSSVINPANFVAVRRRFRGWVYYIQELKYSLEKGYEIENVFELSNCPRPPLAEEARDST